MTSTTLLQLAFGSERVNVKKPHEVGCGHVMWRG